MSQGFDVTGRVIWVTGSSRGIGRGVASHLASAGAAVVVHGRKAEGVEAAVGELSDAGADALGVVADLRDVSFIDSTASHALVAIHGICGDRLQIIPGVALRRLVRLAGLHDVLPLAGP